MGLNGTTLVVSAIERPPYAFLLRDDRGRVTGGRGLVFDILNIIAEKMNFSYVVQTPEDNTLGARSPDGSWTGVIGQLKLKKADLAGTIFTVSNQRMEAVDFSTPLWQGSFRVLLQYPQGKIDSNALLYPFAVTTWLCFALAVVIAGPAMSIVKRAEDYLLSKELSKGPAGFHQGRDGIKQWYWMAYVLLLGKGSPEVWTFAVRVVVLTWSIFTFLLSAFYTANLTAYVTVPMYDTLLERLEDLAFTSRVTWLSRSGTFLAATVEDYNVTDDSGYTRLFVKMREDVRSGAGYYIDSDSDAVQLVLQDDSTVFVRDSVVLQQLVADDMRASRQCRLTLGPESHMKTNEAIAFSKGSQYKKDFDHYIEVLKKRGVMNALVQSHVTNNALSCSISSRRKVTLRPMGASSLLTPCVILGVGLAIASLLFAVEKLKRNRNW